MENHEGRGLPELERERERVEKEIEELQKRLVEIRKLKAALVAVGALSQLPRIQGPNLLR